MSLTEILTNYKTDVINCVVHCFVRNNELYVPKLYNKFNDMFMKWYLSSNLNDIIPSNLSISVEDVTYSIKEDLKDTGSIHEYIGKKNVRKITEIINSKIHNVYTKYRCYNNIFNYLNFNSEFGQMENIFTPEQIKRLESLYTGDDFNRDTNILVNIYNIIGGFNNHLSIPIGVCDESYIELFGSPVNTSHDYCSPLPIEKLFGSLGSFFDYEFVNNQNYVANPPYDENIIHRMIIRINEQLSKTKNVNVIIVVPNWEKFPALNLIKRSSYYVHSIDNKKDNCLFWSYYQNKYISAVDSVAILLSNIHNKHIDTLDIFIRIWGNIVRSQYGGFPPKYDCSKINFSKFKIVEDSLYSCLKPWHIDNVSYILDKMYKGIKIHNLKTIENVVKIVDATGNIGVDSINFIKHFKELKELIVYEIVKETYDALKYNMEVAFKDDIKDCTVTLHNEDFTKNFAVCKGANIVYIDAPWGGIRYNKINPIKLYLQREGDVYDESKNVANICKQVLKYADSVLLKVPPNYDYDDMKTILNENDYNIYNIYRLDVCRNRNIEYSLVKVMKYYVKNSPLKKISKPLLNEHSSVRNNPSNISSNKILSKQSLNEHSPVRNNLSNKKFSKQSSDEHSPVRNNPSTLSSNKNLSNEHSPVRRNFVKK
jgi:hypothetical protein